MGCITVMEGECFYYYYSPKILVVLLKELSSTVTDNSKNLLGNAVTTVAPDQTWLQGYLLYTLLMEIFEKCSTIVALFHRASRG